MRPRTWAWSCSGPRRRSSRIVADERRPRRRASASSSAAVAGAERPRAAARAPAPVGGDDAELALLDQAQPRRGGVVEERAHGHQRGAVDLLAAGGGHQRGAGRAERALAGDGALLLAHEAGHARHDEAEEHDRRRR